MYGCESWTIKKAESWRIDAFELWCWRRLMRIPWIARRWKQSLPKEINPEYSLEGLMLNLKVQYFGHLMQATDSLEKTLMLGKIEDKRRRGQERMRWLDNITDPMDMNLGKLQEIVRNRKAWHALSMGLQRVGQNLVTEQQQIVALQYYINFRCTTQWFNIFIDYIPVCWAPKSLWTVTAAMKLRRLFLGRKAMTNLNSVLKRETLLCLQRSM